MAEFRRITKNEFKMIELGISALLVILTESDDINERAKSAALVMRGLAIAESGIE